MMTSASVLVLGALVPVAAHAQQTLVGAPGQALTAGSISTTSGTVTDNGVNNGVRVTTGSTPVVLATGAMIDTRPTAGVTALDVGVTNGATGPLTVNFAGVNSLQSAASALVVSGAGQATTINLGSGNTFAGGTAQGVNGNTQGADLTIINGANTVSSVSSIGINGLINSATGNLVINSTGGTVSGAFGAINGVTQGGSVVIGQGAGVTSAITGTGGNVNFIGISSTVNGAGAISIRTGAGGTINGLNTGIQATANGSGTATVNVGAAIGGTVAPVSGVRASSTSGNVVVNTTANVTSTNTALIATTGGAGSVNVTSSAASTLTGPRAVFATTQGGAITAALNGQTNGSVYTQVTGAGGVTVNAAGVTGAGNDRAIFANSTTGAINLTTTGAVSGGQGGIYAVSSGANTTISASGPVNGGAQSAIDARNAGLGTTTIGTAGQRTATVTGGTNGIFATSGGDVTVYAGQVTGGTRGIVASNQTSNAPITVNGATLVDVSGLVTANSGNGVTANNNGALAANTTTVRTAEVRSTGGSAISTFSNGGATSITTGALTSAFGNNNGWTGVFAQSNDGAIGVTVNGTINASYRGIDVESQGTGAVGALTINAGSAINGYQGIRAVSTGSAGINIGQTTRTGAIITTAGAGVFASGAGDVNVATGAVTSVGGTVPTITNGSAVGVTADSGFGIAALSSGGAININSNGLISGGAAGGVLAQNTSATGGITINTAAVTANAGRGVAAIAVGGPITVAVAGSVHAAGTAIFAQGTGAGAILVNATGPVSSTTATAVVAQNLNGFGSASVGTAANRIGAVTSATTGIFAASAGDVNVYATSVTGGTRGIVAASQFDTTNGPGNASGRVVIDATGPIVANNSWGIIGVTEGLTSADSLTIRTAAVTGTGRTAISAQTDAGDINVTTTGLILSQASSTLTSNSALFAEATGDGLITVNTQGVVNGYDGIFTRTGGTGVRGGINIVAADAVTGTNQYGIYAHTTGSGIAIQAQGPVSGAIGGVFAQVAGAGAINIATAGVTSSNGPGVFGQSGGSVTINTGAVTAAGGTAVTYQTGGSRNVLDASATSGFGVLGLSTGGNVNLTSTGLVTGGAAGGVFAQTTGAGNIGINTAAVTAAAGRGVEADASGGAITIASTGAINALGTGIAAYNGGAGSIAITNTSTTTSGAGANGIDAANSGTGATSVGTANARLGAVTAGSTGVFATSQGNVSVYASSVTGGTRGIVAASQGAAPNGVVTVNTTGPINAASGFGIVAVNNGLLAANTLSINTSGPVASTGGSGISAQAAGGDVTVNAGAVTASTGTNGTWDGIFAESEGDSRITIATTGAVNGSFHGIDATSTGTTARSGVTVNAGGNVTAGAGNSAILANVNGLGTIAVNTAAGTQLNAANGYGISANVGATPGNNAITIANQASIGGTGTAQVLQGIHAQILDADNAGNIAITSTGGAIRATSAGIFGYTTGTGSVDIGGANGVSSALAVGNTAISGVATTGAVNIRTAAGGTIAGGGSTGIFAQTTTGAITINQAGAIGSTASTIGTGISANIASGTAALTINSTAGIYVTAGTGLQSAGIYAVHGGTGAVNVTSTGVIDPGAYGVVVQGAGPVSYAANGGLVEGGQGAYIASTGGGTVTVTSVAGTPITGLTGVGLQTVGTGGAVSVGTAGAITGATSGLVSSNTGAGATTITTTGAVTGQNGDGVNVSGANGVTTVVAAGPVSGTNSGIVASSTGSGSTVVTNTGAVTSNAGPAIAVASGTGGLTVNVRGNVISATGPAIQATSAAGGTINVAAGTTVAGRVDAPDEAVIDLVTGSGTVSTINVAQGATVQAVSGSPYSTAIRAEGGSVVVNNMGNVNGQIDFSALQGNNTGSLSGGAGTTFQTAGTSTFGAGNDTFTNSGQLVTTGAVTTFDFRGGTNVFNNNGTVFVGFNPVSASGSTFQLLSLTTFNNTGTINLQNGVVGDKLLAPGAAYVGSGSARLLLDAAVGAPVGSSDSVTFGTTSGRTAIVVRDTTPTAFGSYNPTGAVLVNGQTHVGDFVLDTSSSFYNAGQQGGSLDKPGLFFSQLAVNGSGATVLVSLPKVQAYQFSTLAAQAQAVWFATGARAGRQAEVRDQLATGEHAGGAWIEVQGSHGVRSVDRDLASVGGPTAYDASYSQDITGVTVGADTVLSSMGGDVIVGGSVGYVNSDADFDKQQTTVKMDGYEASAYATFVRNGWFVSGTVGGSQLSADLEAPRLTGFTNQSTDISTFGAAVEGGFRAPFLMGTTIEPTAALAYADTNVDDFTVAGSTFRYGDSNTLRPSIGARVSGEAGIFAGQWTTRYNVSLRGVGEALGANQVDLISGGPIAHLDDVHDLGYAEMKAGLVSQSAGGWTAFADVTGRYGDAYKDIGASIGFRVRY
ncbi:hypothetical protein BH10PSE2_BH10PSE2_17920 [soil metagenome]